MARSPYPQPSCDTNSQPAAGRESNDLHDVKQARCHSCKGIHKRGQALHKDFSETGGCITKAFAHLHQKTNLSTTARQIGERSQVAAMKACGWLVTERTAWASLC